MNFLPSIFVPLNLYEIVGTLCCLQMHNEYSKNSMVKHFFCYNARSIFDANVLVIWGGISPKLLKYLHNYCAYLPEKHAIFHIKGCHQSPLEAFPNSRVFEQCSLSKEEEKNALREARQCLIA